MFDLNRREPLFEKVIPLTLSDHQATKIVNLMFRLLEGTFTTIGGQVDHVFHLEITDDNDHSFLYYFNAFESSFHILKSDLRLTFEFIKFPEMLIKNLSQCLASVGQIQSDHASLFNMKLEKRPIENGEELGKLTFVETNTYKETDTLILNCTKGDDKATIMYLSSRLSLAISRQSDQSVDINELNADLNRLNNDKASLSDELQKERMLRIREFEDLKTAYDRQTFAAEKDAQQKLDTLKKSSDKLFSDAQEAWKNKENELSESLQVLNTKYSELNIDQMRLVSQLRDLTSRFEQAESDRDRYLKEVTEARNEQKNALDECAQVQKTCDKLQHKIDSLAERIVIKDEKTTGLAEQIRKNDVLVDDLRDQLKAAQNYGAAQKERNTIIKAEMKRVSEVNASLEADIRGLKEAIANKHDIMRAQEAEVKARGVEIETWKAQCTQSNDTIKTSGHEVARLTNEVVRLEQELTKAIKDLEENKNLCSYLQNELNMNNLGSVYGPSHSHSTTAAAPRTDAAYTSPTHIRQSMNVVDNVGTAAYSSQSYASHMTPTSEPYSYTQIVSNHLVAADTFLSNSPVTPILEPRQNNTDKNVTKLSERTTTRRTVTPNNTPPQVTDLNQVAYYNTDAKYENSATSHRDKSDRSPPAKTQRGSGSGGSRPLNQVTPASGSVKISAAMLLGEEERSRSKNVVYGKPDIGSRKDPNKGDYEWNTHSFV